MARGALPAAFATITRIIPPAFRRSTTVSPAQQSERKVVLGDYYGALASAAQILSPGRARPWPVERAIYEAYERVVWVYRSVEVITGQASRLPFRLKQGGDVLDDHPLYWVLNKRANPMETGRQFRKRLLAQVILSKRGAFVQVTRSRRGDVIRLDLLPPGRTRPVPGSMMGRDDQGNPVDSLIDHYEIVRADGTRSFIPADEVVWFREPHPIDPYSGTTPLEAAGMSVELDFFARLYNTQFLKNDARPGGILGINGDMDPKEMQILEDKFGHGPVEAGKLTVIAGEVSYVDSVVRPRDMQYGTMATNSKIEVLDAFGVPESMMGNAAGKTFDNAGQEGFNFWSITMTPHLDMLVTGFDDLSDDDLEGFFDVSEVPALAAAEAAKREEARTEFAAGQISIDEYRAATGKDPYGLPATRAVIVGNGTTMIPTTPADQKALGGPLVPLGQAAAGTQGTQDAVPGAAQPAAITSGAHPGPGHHDTGPAAADPGETGQPPGSTTSKPDSTAPAAAARPSRATSETKTAPVIQLPRRPAEPSPRRVITACQVKALPAGRPQAAQRQPPSPAAQPPDSEQDDNQDGTAQQQQRQRLEDAVAVALAALTAMWIARTLARLASPKIRKGTRHWAPGLSLTADTRAGTLPLNAGQVIDPAKWQAEADAAARPLVTAAAQASAAGLAARLAPGLPADAVTAAAATAAAPVLTMIAAAAGQLAADAQAGIGQADATGADMGAITEAVTAEMTRQAAAWSAGVACQAATATVSGAAAACADTISAADPLRIIMRTWRTRRDTKVRPTHQDAEGQQQPAGNLFHVGDAFLAYPGDPSGPPSEVRNCRCHLSHRFVPAALAVSG